MLAFLKWSSPCLRVSVVKIRTQSFGKLIGFALPAMILTSCAGKPAVPEVSVYCAVDEPYASQVFADFEKQTGIRVLPLYDIESSKSVGLAGRLTAEKDHPQADVWWGSEAFLTARLANEKILQPYQSPSAIDIPEAYKDKNHLWTGVGLRARVIAVGLPAPEFEIKHLQDLTDPRLKGKIAIARPTAGATGAHVASLYLTLGQDKADAFFKGLRANEVVLLGGNAEVADQVGSGGFTVGLTDTDDITNTQANHGKVSMIVPDQGEGEPGDVTMPTTVALVAGSSNIDAAKKLIDFLESKQTEQKLIDMKFAKWSVRDKTGVKSMQIDYDAAANIYASATRRATAIMEGR